MDEIRVKLDKENLFKTSKNPANQGKVLVFDIIKKSKPLPFEAHITVERISQKFDKTGPIDEKSAPESLKSADFIKIEKNKPDKTETSPDDSTINKLKSVAGKSNDDRSPSTGSRYKITGQKSFHLRNFAFTIRFGLMALVVAFIIPLGAKVHQANLTKEYIKDKGVEVLSDFVEAASSIENRHFKEASLSFSSALQSLVLAQEKIGNLGNTTLFLLASVPGISTQFAQGEKLIQIAKNLTEMGRIFSSTLEKAASVNKEAIKFSSILPDLKKFSLLFSQTDQLLSEINFANLPSPLNSYEDKIQEIIGPFKYIAGFLNDFLPALEEALGVDNPRKYLIIFQNPSEIRPTGGFIGSYALTEIDDGVVKKFKIDDVYNIDGQLRVAVIPPQPIQKVSAAWSFHDANWFFDYPTSARKLQWFYEKTGGATTDGVIAVTPEILGALLKITGPIYLQNHEAMISQDNFIDVLQYEVEVDYDKNIMQPKTILADLGEKIIEKFSNFTIQDIAGFFSQVLDMIDKKEIIFYFSNLQLQRFIESQGWSGKIADFDGDYLAVVNTNLNGYKTDRVIEQTINLNIVLSKDGSVRNSVEVARKHLGGGLPYDWYNKVNTNYLRFFAPLNAELINFKGHTIETVPSRLNYAKAGFKTDPDVLNQELQTIIDKRGVYVSQEGGKRTFGAWTYVSPKEELKVAIEYLSGAKIDPQKPKYQIYLQKQPGVKNQKVNISISYPKSWNILWNFPNNIKTEKGRITYATHLEYDEIISLNFSSF